MFINIEIRSWKPSKKKKIGTRKNNNGLESAIKMQPLHNLPKEKSNPALLYENTEKILKEDNNKVGFVWPAES